MRGVWLLGTAVAALASPPAAAQQDGAPAQPTIAADGRTPVMQVDEEGSVLGDIVVTAQRRVQSLKDVPISVSVFGQDFLSKSRVQTAADLAAFTPGVAGTTVSQTTPRITVRGISTEDFGVGSDPGLGLYVDDVYLGRGVSSISDLFDIERVEIVKGPQGTLFGRNTTAGAISVTTAKPGAEPRGYVEGAYGRFDQIDARGAVSVPLSEDWGLRLAASTRNREGFVRNTLGGRIGAVDSLAGRATLGYDKGSLRAFVSFEGRRGRNQPGPYLNPVLVGGDRYGPISSNLIDGTPDRARDDIDAYRGTLRVELDVSDAVMLTSITAYNGFKNRYLEDTDASPLTLLHFGTRGRQDSWSQEFRLNGNAGRLTWFLGASAAHDDARSTQFAIANEEDYCGILFQTDCTAALGAPGNPVMTEQSIGRTLNTSLAIYGDATFAINSRLDLTAGLRLGYDRKQFSVQVPQNANLLGPLILPPPDLAAVAAFARVDADGTVRQREGFNSLQPRVAVRYEFADGVTAYVSATRGYKAGGFNQLQVGPGFAPEKIWSYEAGMKGELLDRRLRFDLSAYYYDYSDLQVLLNFGGSLITRNAATATGRGVELGVTALPTDGVTISGGLAVQNAKYGTFRPSDAEDFSGNQLVRSPRFTANLVLDVDRSLGNELRGLARAELSYRSSQFFRPSNEPFVRQGGYVLVGGSLGVGVGDRLELRGFVQNAFNKRYLVDAQVIAVDLLAYTQRGEPRIYGIQGRLRF